MIRVTAVVLAAGASSRMGQQKVLMPWGEFPTMGECTIEKISEADPDEIVIVTSLQTHDYFSNRFGNVVLNPNAERGMTSSIQTGVQHASENSDGYMICLADMPLIASNTYASLMESFRQSVQPSIIQPIFQGKPGQPVIFSNAFRETILVHAEPEGCRGIVKANAEVRKGVDVTDHGIHIDIDDEETYRKYLI